MLTQVRGAGAGGVCAGAARGRACCSSTSWTAWRPRVEREQTLAVSWTALWRSCWRRSTACKAPTAAAAAAPRTSLSSEPPTGAARAPLCSLSSQGFIYHDVQPGLGRLLKWAWETFLHDLPGLRWGCLTVRGFSKTVGVSLLHIGMGSNVLCRASFVCFHPAGLICWTGPSCGLVG
jgi:hypothetical protein